MEVHRDCVQRSRTDPGVGQDLMNKPKVTSAEECETHFRIRMDIRCMVRRVADPYQIATVKNRVRRHEKVELAEQALAAYLTTANHAVRIQQARADHMPSL